MGWLRRLWGRRENVAFLKTLPDDGILPLDGTFIHFLAYSTGQGGSNGSIFVKNGSSTVSGAVLFS